MPVARDVSSLLAWLEAATPGTLVPAGEIAERLRGLPFCEVDEVEEEPERLIDADTLAAWLDIDKPRVYRMARDGRLPCVRLGSNTLRFRRPDVQRWLDRKAQ